MQEELGVGEENSLSVESYNILTITYSAASGGLSRARNTQLINIIVMADSSKYLGFC